jgi:hypothetical protein
MFLKDQNDALMSIRARQLQEVDNTNVPQESTVEVPQDTETPNLPVEEVELKEPQKIEETVEEPVVDQTPETTAPKSWDEDDEEPVVTPLDAPKFNFQKLGSALEWGEIKSEEEVVAKVTELKSKLKSLEDNAFEGIPEDFKEVIKISKTGDWKEYLANQLIDFTKLDPVEEYETEFMHRAQKNPKYFTEGKFDAAKAEEALDTVPEPIREAQGIAILDAKRAIQKQQNQAIAQAAQAKVEKAAQTLTSAVKNLNELLPFESYGIKFEAKHSASIHEGISNGSLTKKHLGVSYDDLVRSGADMKVVAATIAKAEYTEKMLKFKAGSSKAEAKKEILKATQNPQIKNTGSVVSPNDQQQKILSPAEKLAQWKASTSKGF